MSGDEGMQTVMVPTELFTKLEEILEVSGDESDMSLIGGTWGKSVADSIMEEESGYCDIETYKNYIVGATWQIGISHAEFLEATENKIVMNLEYAQLENKNLIGSIFAGLTSRLLGTGYTFSYQNDNTLVLTKGELVLDKKVPKEKKPEKKSFIKSVFGKKDKEIVEEKELKEEKEVKEEKPIIEEETIEDAVQEETTSTYQTPFEKGEAYMISDDAKASETFKIFKQHLDQGYEGLCVTTAFPPKIEKKYGIDVSSIVWLSEINTGREDIRVVAPQRMEFELGRVLNEIMKDQEGNIVMLHGIEYLITNQGTENVIKFIQKEKGAIEMNNHILLCSVSKDAFDKKEYENLRLGFTVV